jgi:hypothetical protein
MSNKPNSSSRRDFLIYCPPGLWISPVSPLDVDFGSDFFRDWFLGTNLGEAKVEAQTDAGLPAKISSYLELSILLFRSIHFPQSFSSISKPPAFKITVGEHQQFLSHIRWHTTF